MEFIIPTCRDTLETAIRHDTLLGVIHNSYVQRHAGNVTHLLKGGSLIHNSFVQRHAGNYIINSVVNAMKFIIPTCRDTLETK